MGVVVLILRDGKVGGGRVVLDQVLHNEEPPILGTHPESMRLSNETMFPSFYLSLSHLTL